MPTSTPIGTAKAKASGATLVIPSATAPLGSSMIALAAFETSQGAPVVDWGNKLFNLIVYQPNATAALGVSIHVKPRVNKAGRIESITATWPASIGKRVLIASYVVGANRRDVFASAAETTTTADPSSGATATLRGPGEFAVGAFASEGPSSDTAGTPGDGFSAGQRDGTVGAPPVSNVTLAETTKDLTTTDAVTASLSGATSRLWAVAVAVLRELDEHRYGITPSDLTVTRDLFAGLTVPVDWSEHAFHHNTDLDRWELYQVPAIETSGTLIAYAYDGTVTDWTEV